MFKLPVIVLGIAAALLMAAAAVAAGLTPARAQDGGDALPAAPANVRADDGATAGAVVLGWDGVDAAAFYRIGWVAMDDIPAVQAQGRDWLDAFIFTDVANLGQTAYTITGLVPGRDYAFIVASVSQRFGVAAWSQWAYLTPAGVTSCPDAGGGEPTPPQPSATPAPTLLPTATPMPTATPAPTPTLTPTPQPGAGNRNYDTDGDGLIEVSNLAQLAAIRADLNGDGASPAPAYAAAFPDAMAGMGCPSGCTGYELVTDLDFDTNGNGAADEGDAYWNDGAGWVPIGNHDRHFTATFDGNGHTIANLYSHPRVYYIGLFGYAAHGSIIRQVRLVTVDISSRRSSCIGCGRGGLVGLNHGVIANSYVDGSISAGSPVGGLVGQNSGVITASHANANVSGDRNVGGLVGYNDGTISASYATGDVTASGGYVGGLAGSNRGTIIASYATGNVAGSGDDIGGLVGRNINGNITASYAVGRVSTTGDTFYIGGLVGYAEGGDITASYWDTQSSGQSSSYGGIGKTTAELQSPTNYAGIYADWNLDLDGDGEIDDPWDFGNAGQYPVLQYGGLDVAAQRR